jgi:hypothetical protein
MVIESALVYVIYQDLLWMVWVRYTFTSRSDALRVPLAIGRQRIFKGQILLVNAPWLASLSETQTALLRHWLVLPIRIYLKDLFA